MSETPATRGDSCAWDALSEVRQAVFRNRETVDQLDRRARALLDEMRSLAPPALPPPRVLSPATPTATVAAQLQQQPMRRPAADPGRRLGRRLAVLTGALLAVALAVWLIARDPVGLRSPAIGADSPVGGARPAAPAQAPPKKGQAATAVLLRSFDSVCVKPPDRRPCDGVTLGLWRGDLGAWQALAAQNRLPLPDDDGAYRSAIELRLQMSDPSTRIEAARRSGQAAPFLGAAWFYTTGATHGVEVELRNLGAATADLGGAELVTDRGEVLLRLPPNAALPAGIRCRLSTRPVVSNPCDFGRDTSRRQSTSRPAALILRARTGETVDHFDTAETARPAP